MLAHRNQPTLAASVCFSAKGKMAAFLCPYILNVAQVLSRQEAPFQPSLLRLSKLRAYFCCEDGKGPVLWHGG